MGDVVKPVFGSVPKVEHASLEHEEMKYNKPDKASDCFVALDIGTLSLLVAGNKDSDPNFPRVSPQKTLSRKGSHRIGGGGGGETAAPVAAMRGENAQLSPGNVEKAGVLAHVAGGGEACTSPQGKTPTACRRSGRRLPSPWVNPKRVLLFFATLSSMGTLILLYFTLSMGNMAAGDAANAR